MRQGPGHRESFPSTGKRSNAVEPRRVGIVHEHDVLRRGVAGCLSEEPCLTLAYAVAQDPPLDEPINVAVVSRSALRGSALECAVVVFDVDVEPLAHADSARVAAALSLGHVTAEQLVVSVRAAAAGLTVSARTNVRNGPRRE
jgi:hypothetical protein